MTQEAPNGGYNNQRSAPRFFYPLDIQWQPQAAPVSPPIQGRIRDISVRGFYFFSAVDQPIGAQLTFSVPFKFNDIEKITPILKGIGSVVRCENLGPSHQQGAFGIAVKIDRVMP